MSSYMVQITIEFDKKPNDKDVRKYLISTCKEPQILRWDLQTPTDYIFDAQTVEYKGERNENHN
jgi:hypothetical protein